MSGYRMLALFAAGCADVPAMPSFQTDVAPILAAHCVRCHGFPSIGGAPPDFRLDGYPVTETPAGDMFPAAGAYARLVATRVSAGTMPPRFPIEDYQIEVLERWAESTVVGPALRGEPRPRNRAPLVAFDASTWTYDLHDPDGDLVIGTLRATPLAGGVPIVVANLHSGRDRVALDEPRFAPGTYELAAEVDDGGDTFVVPLGQVSVP